MQKPPPEVAGAFARGDFSGVADWAAKEGDFSRMMRTPKASPQPQRTTLPTPSPRQTEVEALRRLFDYRPVADWLLAAILAAFMAFATGVLTWRYRGPDFGPRYDFLSLLGVLLLCYWAVLAARRLWQSR